MTGSSVVRQGLWVALLLVLADCGGRTADSSGAAPDDTTVNGGSGGAPLSAADDECAGSAADGGCGGEAGERALEPGAPLHTACGRTLQVNRAGAPVSICYHIR